MKKVAKILIAGGVCSVFWAMPASASTNLETSSSLAGISVALNNFYASTEEPEQALASVFDAAAATSVASGGGGGGGASGRSGLRWRPPADADTGVRWRVCSMEDSSDSGVTRVSRGLDIRRRRARVCRREGAC